MSQVDKIWDNDFLLHPGISAVRIALPMAGRNSSELRPSHVFHGALLVPLASDGQGSADSPLQTRGQSGFIQTKNEP